MTSNDEFEPSDLLRDMFSAEWLMRQQFPPLQYVVPGLIPEGLTLLAAAPKIGKSWMVLGLGIACATGGFAFGQLSVDPRPVLYLALEDGKMRLNSRLLSLGIDPLHGPRNLKMLIDVKPGFEVATIRAFVERHGDESPLVVLDTLGKAMPPAFANETPYARDYRVTGALKSVVGEVPGASLLAAHHTRKLDATDFLDAVSGTQGVAGAADTILVLTRNREEPNAILRVTSRDAPEGSYALQIDGTGRWSLSGATLEEAARAVRTGTATAGLGDRMTELVAYVLSNTACVRRSEVAAALNMDEALAGNYLRRAYDAGRIASPSRGIYGPPTPPGTSGTSGTSPSLVDVPLISLVPPTRHGPRPEGNRRCRVCGEALHPGLVDDTHPGCQS